MGPAGLEAELATVAVIHPHLDVGAQGGWEQGRPPPVVAFGETWLSLVSCSGQGELFSLWQPCSFPSHDHLSRLKAVPWHLLDAT